MWRQWMRRVEETRRYERTGDVDLHPPAQRKHQTRRNKRSSSCLKARLYLSVARPNGLAREEPSDNAERGGHGVRDGRAHLPDARPKEQRGPDAAAEGQTNDKAFE
jgi:hypothetical protein